MDDVSPEQAEALLRGVTTAVRSKGTLTETQRNLLSAVGTYLLDQPTTPDEVDGLEPLSADDLAAAVDDDDLRQRAVHAMVTLEIITDPVPTDVADRVEQYAAALHVDEPALAVARDYANRAMDVAVGDLIRNSYAIEYHEKHPGPGGRAPSAPIGAEDPELVAKWQALESCPPGSHGRIVWEFYRSRGFTFPGEPGAVDTLLAQHDWVHCLADYGTSAIGEIEVFTFIASAIPDPKAYSYAVIILGLFETGYLPGAPGVATANPGHLSKPGGTTRFVDALKRGLTVRRDVMGGTDWFEYADTPIDDVRRQFGVPSKSDSALEAGSLPAMHPSAVFGKDG